MVAKYYQLIGEIYEEFKNYPEAIKNFEEAADYYNTEGAYSTANKCFLKVATYSALADDYAKAIKYYEDVIFFQSWKPKVFLVKASKILTTFNQKQLLRKIYDHIEKKKQLKT